MNIVATWSRVSQKALYRLSVLTPYRHTNLIIIGKGKGKREFV